MKFEILIGPEDGQVRTFSEDEVTIGRQFSENLFIIAGDGFVSKKHATVRCEGRNFTLADVGNDGAGSTHGTHVKDQSLRTKAHLKGEQVALEAGDIFIVGITWVRFLGE